MSEPKKTIVINPDFLKLPMKGKNKTKKNTDSVPKPIKIRSEKKSNSDKTIKRSAMKNYIRKMQEEKYKRLVNGLDDDGSSGHVVETTQGKTYADEFKSSFDDSLSFLQKLTDQTAQKMQVQNATLKHYPPIVKNSGYEAVRVQTNSGELCSQEFVPNSTLFQAPILDKILDENICLEEPNVIPRQTVFAKPLYGCLKGGSLPTYRTLKEHGQIPSISHSSTNPLLTNPLISPSISPSISSSTSLSTSLSTGGQSNNLGQTGGSKVRLSPEQQRAELKQFLEKRKEEKQRVERVKRQRDLVKPHKKQKRTTTRTFRVGKSKHYPRVGVLIPNKTIRTQVLAKKQKIRETSIEDMRRYLIKKGLIRVGSSCPNDVLRQMYESSMMMCGEIQNHNPDNLLYNYLHNGI